MSTATRDFRIERDTMGDMRVPAGKLWGAQTQRSLENFRISEEKMPQALVYALALVKKAAALVNMDLQTLDPKLGYQADLVDPSHVSAGLLLHSSGCSLYVSTRLDFPHARRARRDAGDAKTHRKPNRGTATVVAARLVPYIVAMGPRTRLPFLAAQAVELNYCDHLSPSYAGVLLKKRTPTAFETDLVQRANQRPIHSLAGASLVVGCPAL